MAYSPARNRQSPPQSVTTTDATVTTIKTIPIKLNSVVNITAVVTAIRTGGTAGDVADAAGYWRLATVRNTAGTAAIVGAVTDLKSSEIQAAWDCTISVSGGTALVTVTGAANNNITWSADIKVVSTI